MMAIFPIWIMLLIFLTVVVISVLIGAAQNRRRGGMLAMVLFFTVAAVVLGMSSWLLIGVDMGNTLETRYARGAGNAIELNEFKHTETRPKEPELVLQEYDLTPTSEPKAVAQQIGDKRPAEEPQGELDISTGSTLRIVDEASRPAWLTTPRQHAKELDTQVVTSGPYSTRGECDRALDEAMLAATHDYVNDYLDQPGAAERLAINLAFVRQHALADHYDEEIVLSIGPMRQSHALLQYDESLRDEVRKRWQQLLVSMRLGVIGLIAAGVVGLLGLVYGLSRIDASTRGYYSRSLLWGGATAVVGIIVLVALVAMLTLKVPA